MLLNFHNLWSQRNGSKIRIFSEKKLVAMKNSAYLNFTPKSKVFFMVTKEKHKKGFNNRFSNNPRKWKDQCM